MSNVTYAFVFNGNGDWRTSNNDDWEFSFVEDFSIEKILGHKKIDSTIYKVAKLSDNIIIALVK